jgi:hypothetical protein
VSRPALALVEGRPRPRFGPALELAALGAGLTVTFTLLGALPSWYRNLGTFQGLYVLAFAFYGLALLRLRRYAAIPRVGLAVFGVALAIRAAVFPVPPTLSGDIFRYVWEGRVVVAGGNPYRQGPLDPALAPLRDRDVHPRINHPELSTIYPPLAMAGFALVARIAPTVPAFKLWVALHDLALILLLLAWARRRGTSPAAVIAYAWNPLMAVEYAGSGHNDPTALVWLALALMLADRRPLFSALALAAGALVKLAPLVALPFLIARWPWRARLAALGSLAVGLGWYVAETGETYSGRVAYWGSWRNNELLFHYVERWTGDFAVARTLSLVLVAAALAWAAWRAREPAPATRVGLGAGLLASPVLHPWYLGWTLMFEPLSISAPWLLLSLTMILNYGVFALPAEGRAFHLPIEWRWVEYGIPLGVALLLALRRRRGGPAGPAREG